MATFTCCLHEAPFQQPCCARGHSVAVLLKVYAMCLDGKTDAALRKIEASCALSSLYAHRTARERTSCRTRQRCGPSVEIPTSNTCAPWRSPGPSSAARRGLVGQPARLPPSPCGRRLSRTQPRAAGTAGTSGARSADPEPGRGPVAVPRIRRARGVFVEPVPPSSYLTVVGREGR